MTDILYINEETYSVLMRTMAVMAGVVFVLLFIVKAGYGMFYNRHWGPTISNRKGWMLMEAPAFFVILAIAYVAVDMSMDLPDEVKSEFPFHWQSLLLFVLFELHYFQRSFVFPYKMKGRSKMPIVILLIGVVFNTLNSYIIGMGLFRFCPDDLQISVFTWMFRPNVVAGVLLFFVGMLINMHSDRVVRHLRRHGETGHYLPTDGLFKYVTSANYLGELIEWTGFALAAMMPGAWLFVLWTAANLVPRAHSIHRRYRKEFGDRMGNRKRLIPFIY